MLRGLGRWSAAAAVIGTLAVASPAEGATTIGQDLSEGPAGILGCAQECTFRAASIAPADGIAAGGLTAPMTGVVVRFSFRVTAATQEAAAIVRPRVLRGQAGAGTSDAVILADADGIQTFATRLPIIVGDGIGFDVLSPGVDLGIARLAAGPSTVELFAPPLVDGAGPQAPAVSGGGVIQLNADIEADADADGFGDETQDRCPAQAATQGACVPPETTIKLKKLVGKNRDTLKVSFSASDPAATFTCKLDGKAPKSCTSPVKYKNLAEGKHKVFVTATKDAADPTPAVAKVKVKPSD